MSPPSLLSQALAYVRRGRSIYPIQPRSKRPSGPWKEFQTRRPTEIEVRKWFDTGNAKGIALITGEISGVVDSSGVCYGLEILDIDDPDIADTFLALAADLGLGHILPGRPQERTPGGGLHIGWLCEVTEGNLKLAQRDETPPGSHRQQIKTLIETRGEGGCCVVSPTPRGIHPIYPSKSYEMISGTWTHIPPISPDNRNRILNFARSFNTYLKPIQTRTKAELRSGSVINGERPGDKLNLEADREWWISLLERNGWAWMYQHGDTDYWQRPGKEARDKGISATLGACGPYFYVFSSNASPFEGDRAYLPFTALTLLEYDGDFKACAKTIAPPHKPLARVIPDFSDYEGDVRAIDAALEEAIENESRTHLPYQTTKDRRIREMQFNYELMLSEEAEWKGRLRFNEFSQSVEVDGNAITDLDRHLITSWASREFGITGSGVKIRDCAIDVVAHKDTYDPLRDFVNDLPEWDGVERIEHFLSNVCGAEESAYSGWCGRMLLVQMIARALDPGCIARYVVILEGPELIGKSEFVAAIGSPWTKNLELTLDSKEAHMILAGCWVVELAELGTLRKSSLERIKSFISARSDSFIPKYSNERVDRPRRCVFIGTTNDDDYLVGDTGNTRFLPIKTSQINLTLLKENRLQYWAEAKRYWEEHQNGWWEAPKIVSVHWEVAREERKEMNPYQEELHNRLYDDGYPSVTWEQLAKHFLMLDNKRDWADKRIQLLVTSALKRIGYEKGAQTRDKEGHRYRKWVHPSETAGSQLTPVSSVSSGRENSW